MSAAPAPNRARRAGSTTALGAAALALVVVALGACSGGDDKGKSRPGGPKGPAPVQVQAPDDGRLRLGRGERATTLDQIAGSCEVAPAAPRPAGGAGVTTPGSTCRFDGGELEVVAAPAGELELAAAKSRSFSLSAIDVANPTTAAPISVTGSKLSFPSAAPGEFRITLLGDAGGVWQFVLEVSPAP